LFRSRKEQAIVELALRQQLAALSQRKSKPKITPLDRVFWVAPFRFWPLWKRVLVIVKPDTVVRWHRKGFRLYWRWISNRGPGRPPISPEVQALIKVFALDNGWGARKVHAELGKLGFTISLATVSRYMPKQPGDKGKQQRWVGSCKRELIDHVIVLNERHLRRLLRGYVRYYNTDRVHTSIQDAPEGRPAEKRPSPDAKVVELPRVGGLHRRYAWKEAAQNLTQAAIALRIDF
jgi:hypothetical protein